MSNTRIGLGFDRHRLAPGRALVLGGVAIPHDKGLQGHSDADVLLHAACDAVLSAAGLDDLGTLFSDRDARWKDADSRHLTRLVMQRVQAKGYRVAGLDAVLIADEPRVAPHRPAMRASLAGLFAVDPDAVNVKGKTTEGFPVDAIDCWVVALLERAPDA